MPHSAKAENKLKFLIFGGCGFIGRHVVQHLVDKSASIIVVDKTPPEIAWMSADHLNAFKNEKVTFISANLASAARCSKALEKVDGDVDYIINLASETRKGQSDIVYKEGIHQLTLNIIEQVQEKFSNFKRFVHFSTGYLYPSDKNPHEEKDKEEVWTAELKYKLQAELEIKKHLKKYIILRPAITYGPGDRDGIMPRFVVGAVYKHLNEMMKLPWNDELRIHTVHVSDVTRAALHLALEGVEQEIYNIVDNGDTTQGKVTEIVCDIFGINHDYWGNALTKIARADTDDVIEDINEKHLGPWATLCSSKGIANTPLSPCIYKDAFTKHHISLDGKKLASTGFTLNHPNISHDLCKEVLKQFISMKLFPDILEA